MLSSPQITWSGLVLRIPASAPFFSVLVLLTCTFWQLLIKSWLPLGNDRFVPEKQHGLPDPHVRSFALLLNTAPLKSLHGFSEVTLFIRKSQFFETSPAGEKVQVFINWFSKIWGRNYVVMLPEFNIFKIRHFFLLEHLLVSNIYVLKGLKYSEVQMEKVVFEISVIIFQISPIIFPLQNFHALFLVSLGSLWHFRKKRYFKIRPSQNPKLLQTSL